MQQKQQVLHKKIKRYSQVKSASSYYQLGKTYIELWEISANQQDLKEAINAFSEAFKLKNDTIYLWWRAKTYHKLSDFTSIQNAVKDIQQAVLLAKDDQNDPLKYIYNKNMLKQLEKIQIIGQKIKNFKSQGLLQQKYFDSFHKLIYTSQQNCLTVGLFEQKVQKMESQIQQMRNMISQQNQLITKFNQQMQNKQNIKLEEFKIKVEELTFRQKYAQINHKILSQKVNVLQKFKANFPQKAMMYFAQQKKLQQFMNKLDTKKKNHINDYIDGFISQCSMVYTTALVIKSGHVKIDSESVVLTFASKIFALIPFIGSVAQLIFTTIQTIYGAIKQTKLQAKAQNITKYLPSMYQFQQQLRYIVADIIFNDQITKIILISSEQGEKWYQVVQNVWKQTIKEVKNAIQKNQAQELCTPFYKLGVKNASEMLDKVILNGKILKENNNKIQVIKQQLITIIKKELQQNIANKQGPLTQSKVQQDKQKLKIASNEPQSNNSENKDSCQIF